MWGGGPNVDIAWSKRNVWLGRAGKQPSAGRQRMPAFPMLPHGRATAPRGYGARLQRWCPSQNQGGVFVGCTLRACDWFQAGLARPRRKGEHCTTVPTCHIGAIFTSLGANCTHDPILPPSTSCLGRATNCSTPRGVLGGRSALQQPRWVRRFFPPT